MGQSVPRVAWNDYTLDEALWNVTILFINVRLFNATIPNKHRMNYAKPNQAKAEVKIDESKRTFKYVLEVPEFWKSVARIDLNADNIK